MSCTTARCELDEEHPDMSFHLIAAQGVPSINKSSESQLLFHLRIILPVPFLIYSIHSNEERHSREFINAMHYLGSTQLDMPREHSTRHIGKIHYPDTRDESDWQKDGREHGQNGQPSIDSFLLMTFVAIP